MKKVIKAVSMKWIIRFLPLLLMIPIYMILYKIYIPRVNAFRCFDDCNNFMRGYFVLQGNYLFSEVFSGHQPFGFYLSTIIQAITSPQNIFELVLRHRQFILLFGFFFNIILILRFGLKVLLFTIIFEFSKFYIFGDRFLGDGMIVYLFIYLGGLVFLKLEKKKIHSIDYILAPIFCWLIIFTRSPYVPAAIFTYLFFLWSCPLKTIAKNSLILFVGLSLFTILVHDVNEYFFNVVVFNYQANLPAEGKSGMFGPNMIQSFLYPLYIFFYGPLNIFKALLIGVNVVFLTLFVGLIRSRKYMLTLFIFIALGLVNIRIVVPGKVFYSAFHMLPWYGFFVFTTVFLLFRKKSNKYIFYLSFFILLGSFMYFIFSPSYFAKEKINQHTEFMTNYGYILQEGEVIRALAIPTDTLFLDGSDDLIYWQAKLPSSYKYSWYTSSMPAFKRYTDARLEMFQKAPPVFYREFGSCPKKTEMSESYKLPDFIKNQYVRLYGFGKPSCIFVRKDKIPQISDKQWQKAKEFNYELP